MSPAETRSADCARALEVLNRQLDGEIDGTVIDCKVDEADRRQLEEHLAECSSCRSEAGLARQLSSGLRGLGPQPCPDSTIAGLMSRVAQEAKTSVAGDRANRNEGAERTAALAEAEIVAPFPTSHAAPATPERGRSATTLALAATLLLTLAAGLWLSVSSNLIERPVDVQPLTPDASLSEAELEQAEREARLAFAYLGAITKRATETLRNDVLTATSSASPPSHLRDEDQQR